MNRADQVYLELMRRLPSWVFRGLRRVLLMAQGPLMGSSILGDKILGKQDAAEAVPKDPVYGPLARLFGEFYEWLDLLIDQTQIGTAEGAWLDLHAEERGTQRRNESDYALRERIRSVPETCTDRALLLTAQEICGQVEGIDAYTVRNREAVLDRDFFDDGAILAGTVIPRPREEGRGGAVFLDANAWLDVSIWGDYGQRRRDGEPSGWLLAHVVIPPLIRRHNAFFDQAFMDKDFFGDTAPDYDRYRQLREAIEERRAAGTTVHILIEEPEG